MTTSTLPGAKQFEVTITSRLKDTGVDMPERGIRTLCYPEGPRISFSLSASTTKKKWRRTFTLWGIDFHLMGSNLHLMRSPTRATTPNCDYA